MPKLSLRRGFTLIELLVVISIIALLSVVVFVALNPIKRFQDARNSRRWSDVDNILTAIHTSIVDNGGSLPAGLTTGMSAKQLGTCASGGATLCTGANAVCLDLATPLVKYLKSLPIDPQQASGTTTYGYSVAVDSNNIVTVTSCSAENSIVVSMSR
ncbi:MAG: type II secretion system protein [bacterium]